LADEAGFRPSKALGQNFVVDPNTIHKVVRLSGIDTRSNVFEVGAGFGSLTNALAEVAARVVAVELDRSLVDILKASLDPKVSLLAADVMELDLAKELGSGEWQLVANLPYNIATPLVIKVLEDVPAITALTFMVQKEVGNRMVAEPSDSAYGAVSAQIGFFANAKIVSGVPRSVFWPKPDVESVIVEIRRVDDRGVDYRLFKRIVKGSFSQRRKRLSNPLSEELQIEKSRIEAALVEIGRSEESRAEELSTTAFLSLTEELGR
jgi:16S rRNA (adenine1518-N6/adenine1519-N6)-dimethyltransferase